MNDECFLMKHVAGSTYVSTGPYTYEEAKAERMILGNDYFIVKKCAELNRWGAPVNAYPWPDLDNNLDEDNDNEQ